MPIKIRIKTMNLTVTDKYFPTDNFQLACFLLCEGCLLKSVDKSNPRRVVFNFEENDSRKKVTDKFLRYESLVEPHKFFSAQKDLKQLIYSD